MVAMLARDYDMDVQRLAEHLNWPQDLVEAPLVYARQYGDEIDPIVDDVASMTAEDLKARYPAWGQVGVSESAGRP